MSFLSIRSLRAKLIWIQLATTVTVLLVCISGFLLFNLKTMRNAVVANLLSTSRVIATNSRVTLQFDDADAAREVLAALETEENIVGACLLNADGEVFAVCGDLDIDIPRLSQEIPTLTAKPDRKTVIIGDRSIEVYREIWGEHEGHVGTLYLKSDMSALDTVEHQSLLIALLVIASGIIISSVLANLLQRRISQPVLALVEVARDVSTSRDYAIRVQETGDDELGILCYEFNDMMHQIQKRDLALQKAHEELEDRVIERTRELESEIIERKKMENELRLFTAKLKWSNRELQEFASVASHDLQEPLRKVRAFSDRLKAVCGDELSEKASDYLDRMQSAAGRMQTLIEDLLVFSRVTSRAKPFVNVELERIAREVLSDLEVTIDQLGGRVELGKLPAIMADPLQMRQLLQNLISNGLKFHKEGKPPVVKVYCELDKEQNGPSGANTDAEFFRLVVEDDGIGFDEKYCDKVFSIFQRLHSRSEYEGTGIGLAVCRKIVERHEGSITARSTPGRGARFIATLPLKQCKGEQNAGCKRETDPDLVSRG